MGQLIYATGNLIDKDTLKSVTTENSIYKKENLYNKRPSKPFRFTAKAGNQIRVDLGAADIPVTIVGVINHNLYTPTLFRIKAAAANPPAGGDWDHPDWYDDLTLCAGLKNSYKKINQTFQHWVLDIDDALNPDPNQSEIGEYLLTTWSKFTDAYIMADSEALSIVTDSMVTAFEQDWDEKLSECYRLNFTIRNETTRGLIDEIRTFIKGIDGAAGRFLLIPDEDFGQCYYGKVEGTLFTAERIYHGTKDILEREIAFKSLVEGISML